MRGEEREGEERRGEEREGEERRGEGRGGKERERETVVKTKRGDMIT